MHALLGIAEPHFMQHTGATFKLASEHVGWQGEGSGFLHAHGEIGKELDGMPFYRYLQREALAGRPERPEDFSVAGQRGAPRQVRAADGPSSKESRSPPSFTYGFHVAELAVHAVPARACVAPRRARRLRRHWPRSCRGEAGDIQALRLADGTTAEADLFVDCSGPAARLLGACRRRTR